MTLRKNVIVIGASSGIGFELTKELLRDGHSVWGVARRTEALQSAAWENKNLGSLNISQVDISRQEEVASFAQDLQASGFVPYVVVVNAGIYQNDMEDNISYEIAEEMMRTNYMGAMHCVHELMPLVPHNGQFIAISSSSALKGSAYEGAGYAASKAALSLAFESFFLKWSGTGAIFTTIYFGPLDTSLRRTKGYTIFLTSAHNAAHRIIKAMEGRKPVYYHPVLLFFFLRLAKLLPQRLYFALLRHMESKMQ